MKQVRSALLSSFTLDNLATMVSRRLACQAVDVEWYIAPFAQYPQEILDPASGLAKHRPAVVFLAVDVEDLLRGLPDLWTASAADRLTFTQQRIQEFIALIRQLSGRLPEARVLVHNFYLAGRIPNPFLNYNLSASPGELVLRCNQALVEAMSSMGNVSVLDVSGALAQSGWERSCDARFFYLAKMRFSAQALDELVALYERVIKAYLGLRKKCVVLDLDNTLWGGVLGDEGIEHILLSDDGPGRAFQDFQRVLLDLYHSGVILIICSKNDEGAAVAALRDHPHMLLRPQHFAASRINWRDKVSNLLELSRELNLGLDSFVFVDDSPFERGLIRHALPEVTVVDLPADPSDYAASFATLPYFDTLAVTQEDTRRTQMYFEEGQRKTILQSARSLEDFLHSLDIRVQVKRPDAFLTPRVAQLTQKTNQFNLTTRRYQEGEITRFLNDGRWRVYCAEAADRVGSNGVVGVAIAELQPESQTARLDTFLVSCRVLGRGIESAFLAGVVAHLFAEPISTLRAQFIRTERNEVAKEFLPSQGFRMSDGVWELGRGEGNGICPKWITLELAEVAA